MTRFRPQIPGGAPERRSRSAIRLSFRLTATSMALNGRISELSQTSDDNDRSAPFLIISSIILMLPVTTK
jgi:hypothetical protein